MFYNFIMNLFLDEVALDEVPRISIRLNMEIPFMRKAWHRNPLC